MVPFESLGAVSYSPSIVTMALSSISSEIKPDIGRKSWFFHSPLHSTPLLGGYPSDYRHPVWYGETRMVGLPDSEKKLWGLCNRLHTIPAYDGQTDRQTSCHGIVRAMYTRRAVKIDEFIYVLISTRNQKIALFSQCRVFIHSFQKACEVSYFNGIRRKAFARWLHISPPCYT